MSYRARFEQLLRTLQAHPDVEVYAWAVEPPASAARLADAERFLNVQLPPAMRAFYTELNGFFVEWAPIGDKHEEKTSPFGYPDYGQPPGCINLLPIEEALTTAWQEEYHVNEIQSDHWEALYGRPQTEAAAPAASTTSPSTTTPISSLAPSPSSSSPPITAPTWTPPTT